TTPTSPAGTGRDGGYGRTIGAMHRTTAPLRLGLTGGIGSGKSTVAALWRAAGHRVIDLAAHSRRVLDVPGQGVEGAVARFEAAVAALWRAAGHRVIDVDARSRRVLDVPGQGVEEAVARFGEEFRAVDGTIDRAALARLVFADAAARADLERIVLTRVDTAVAREEAEAARAGERVIVHDSPLLLEKGHEDRYGAVVAVLARREDRIDRVVRDRAKDRAYV